MGIQAQKRQPVITCAKRPRAQSEGTSISTADGVRFFRTPAVPRCAGQFGRPFDNGEDATALAIVTGSAGTCGPDRKIAGVGCAERPRDNNITCKSVSIYVYFSVKIG